MRFFASFSRFHPAHLLGGPVRPSCTPSHMGYAVIIGRFFSCEGRWSNSPPVTCCTCLFPRYFENLTLVDNFHRSRMSTQG